MDPDPDHLDDMLDRWKSPPPPSHLEAEVWRRIAVAEAEEASDTDSLWKRIEIAFRRPSFALTFVTACMLAGLFMAELRLSKLHQGRSTQFAQSYLKLIDPLLADTHASASNSLHPEGLP